MDHRLIEGLMEGIAPVIKESIAAGISNATAPLRETIADLQLRLEKAEKIEVVTGPAGLDGKDGRDGIDGKDGAPGEVGERGLDGKDGSPGERGEAGEKGEKGDPGQDGKDGAPGERGLDGKDGAAGERGEKGDAGRDGKDGADVEQVLAALLPAEQGLFSPLKNVVAEYFKAFPPPAGRDGMDGKDGAPGAAAEISVVPDDIAVQISKAVTLLSESPQITTKAAPFVLNITAPERTSKTITTRRDEAGNLVANVVEH